MGGIDEETRELRINTEREAADGVLVTMRDFRPRLDPADTERVFQAFYTTKAKGMGLAICRSADRLTRETAANNQALTI